MINFDTAFKNVIGHEGGYVNDPNDRGGETKYGISKLAYPNVDIKSLTLEDAKRIYRKDYWNKLRADELPTEIREAAFNFAVNMGVKSVVKVIQKASNATVDGIIGSQTLKASEDLSLDRFLLFIMERYMNIIANRHQNANFARGWANRVMDFT